MKIRRNESTPAWRSQVTSPVFIGGCLIPAVVIAADVMLHSQTSALLSRVGNFSMAKFNHWIIWSVSLFLVYCAAIAVIPALGKQKLGVSSDRPEFSYFSWFCMIFGAGLGVGMLTWGVTEPISGMKNNPDVVRGITDSVSDNNFSSALKWSYIHWGLSAWACYAVVGLAIAYTGYRQKLPLTFSASLVPLFGESMRGKSGAFVDMCAVGATILCIIQTLGYALEETVICFAQTTGVMWLMSDDGSATIGGKLGASTLIVALGAASAMSGIHKGVKWLSNVNVLVSLCALAIILVAGSFKDGVFMLISSIFGYLTSLPEIMFSVWSKDETDIGNALQEWQGTWSVFHWSWWIAFAPFVGVFLAKISKGRTVREYLAMTVVLPALFCMVWMTIAGGNALLLELHGDANGAIFEAVTGQKIFVMVQHLFNSQWIGFLVSCVLVVLLVTYLATSIDSALVVIKTLTNQDVSSKSSSKSSSSQGAILVWAVMLAIVMGVMVLSSGFYSVRAVMVVAAVPISVMITLLAVSVSVAMYKESYKRTDGVVNQISEFGFSSGR